MNQLRVSDPRLGRAVAQWRTPSRLNARDLAVLLALDQYRCLTTDQLASLFFPSLRSAQKRLRRLCQAGLIISGPPIDVTGAAWRPQSAFHALSLESALVLGKHLEIETVTLANGLWPEGYVHDAVLDHDLPVNDFFVSLVVASRGVPGHGLYHWVGRAALLREYQPAGLSGGADGWGRYLLPGGELPFFLEYDSGEERPNRLATGVLARAVHLWRRPAYRSSHVLIVTPQAAREARIGKAILRATPSPYLTRLWTTTPDLLEAGEGVMAPIWQPIGGRSRLPLIALPIRPDSGYMVEDAIGTPDWWLRRPGGGEAA